MTSPLRRRRPTTVPAPSTPAPRAFRLAAAGLLLLAGAAAAAPPGAAPGPRPAAPPAPLPAAIRDPAVVPAQAQQYPVTASDAQSLVDLPGPDKIFQLESEAALFTRLRNEERAKGNLQPLVFPEEPVVSKDQYYGRDWPRRVEYAEPSYVCHKRLLFEQPNFERYGWDLGLLTPVVSAGEFFGDVVLLPYNAFSDPFRCYECSAGYCLPGDPVPLLLYPHECSAAGAVAEAAAVVTVLAVFP